MHYSESILFDLQILYKSKSLYNLSLYFYFVKNVFSIISYVCG